MFGMPYGAMYGNMMQSGQQTGVPSGVFGMPGQFTPTMQNQQQTTQQQTTQQQTAQNPSMVQQVASATNYSQPNINLGDPNIRQTFLDEYKKLYTDQLYSKDTKYKQLANTLSTAQTSANNYQQNWARQQDAAERAAVAGLDPGKNINQLAPYVDRLNAAQAGLAGYQAQDLENQRNIEKAQKALDAYLNPLWQSQQGTLDTLFSGQITPQMLLQGMTRGLLG